MTVMRVLLFADTVCGEGPDAVRLPRSGLPIIRQQQGRAGGQRHPAHRPAAGLRAPCGPHILSVPCAGGLKTVLFPKL